MSLEADIGVEEAFHENPNLLRAAILFCFHLIFLHQISLASWY